jgi:hypothetical protein
MANTILLKQSAVGNAVPELADLELGEVAINTYDAKLYAIQQQGLLEEVVDLTAASPITNTLFVQTTGNDNNLGTSWAESFATIERAVVVAEERRVAGATITLIEVGAGVYVTEGHIDFPDNTVIRCAHRSVAIRPAVGFEERNVFRIGSGCFVEGFLFENWRLDSLTDPSEGFAISFRPDAIINRVPYAHKIAVRTNPYWTTVPPPLDRDPLVGEPNPLVGRGAGVALADGNVCSQFSVFPNIMTWGATPVSQNGIGYCAKKGGLINAVNAVSLWAHKHFLALDGGQIVLSACSTQFGDYTMWAEGSRPIVDATETTGVTLEIDLTAEAAIEAAQTTIINNMWTAVSTTVDPATGQVYTFGWSAQDETDLRFQAATFIQCIRWVLESANELPMLDFAEGLFGVEGNTIYSSSKQAAYIFSFNNMRGQMTALAGVGAQSDLIITALVTALEDTLTDPVFQSVPSTITAIGHTWTAVLSGVALTKIPPVRNEGSIEESIVEKLDGIVIASGQDDQGNAIFVGGMKISADTGELSGPPFEQAVNRIATKAAIARSF